MRWIWYENVLMVRWLLTSETWQLSWWCGWIACRSFAAGLLRPGWPLARSSRWSCCRTRSWTSWRGGWLGWWSRSQPRSWRDKEQSSRRNPFDDCDSLGGWDGYMVGVWLWSGWSGLAWWLAPASSCAGLDVWVLSYYTPSTSFLLL